jgi:hypothetical protein
LFTIFATGIVDTGGEFATNVVDTGSTGGKIYHWWCNLTANISANFQQKSEMTLMLFSGAWGKMIHDKNLKQQIS